ncbi:acetaldehyde dehydrogenase (acetylating) [Sebaldella sp. S0638]|uniref:acetaldehyde dehydrogenase (acetylating) n=1 Tax=Sebaldella sp. S0638 TaxID=2957809 RepID=UPI0020A1BA4A|nr:acetaldehyde dehydrogenase (acetylating) [Sebaldella sp. S0638]MCP1225914.1 acetaldehyde dehydrogenase (acetylating) [Sebaldella sp. S0638]
MDKDLLSIQEVRDLLKEAKKAQSIYSTFTQEQIDAIIKELSQEATKHEVELAKMANQETGFGKWEDKVLKNRLAAQGVYEYIKDMKTTGIINEDKNAKIIEIGVPMGIIAALIPSTNPTSTVIYKTMISLKAGNAVVISPHPNAKECILRTAEILINAAERMGAPKGLIGVIKTPTLQATNELMKHKDTSLILATGGEAMVKAAYSSGTPAIGVGPGNGPAFIERSADVKLAVKRILDSKTFDNGVICASEQSIVTESIIRNEVIAELKKQGAYFLNREERDRVGSILMRANGTMNPKIVGRTAVYIAEMAGISVPSDTRVLVSEEREVSHANPYSREKLCPVLGFYTEENWETACERCIEILQNEGVGHTMTIHSENDYVIREFALKKPVSRLLINTAAALGGVGATTNLAPAFTLGCGAVGGSSTSDNISPLNLMNIRRAAYGTKELCDLRNEGGSSCECSSGAEADLEQIVKKVLNELLS